MVKYLNKMKDKYDRFMAEFAIATAYTITVAILVIIFLLYQSGYQILLVDYKAVPDWEAITAVATIVLPTSFSIIAIYISMSTSRRQNRIALFEKRINCYNILTGCIALYSSNKSLLEEIKSEALYSNVDVFVGLTNNVYLQEIAHAIANPLDKQHHITYLTKLENLQLISKEIKFVFGGEKAIYAESFIIDYKNLLHKMYQFEIAYNSLEKRNSKQPMSFEVFQQRLENSNAPSELTKAVTALDKSYKELMHYKVIDEFENQLKL